MDGNKDESEKCIQIALKYVRSGDKEKALKFLGKAQKLYPSKKAEELINSLKYTQSGAASGEEQDRCGASSASGNDTSYQRSESMDDTQTSEAAFTSDQVTLVRKIQRCKDYYEILGVTKDCEDDDLKKAYRKLALKLHPDKNKAPGATEAFKAVGKAFGVLSDNEKRRRYDLYGSEAERSSGHQHSHRHRHSHGNTHYYYDDDDISAEEIFNMFFGGAYNTRHVNRNRTFHTRNFQTFNNSGPQQTDYSFLLQISPLLIMVLISLLGSFLVPDSHYALNRDGKYTMERVSKNLGIKYYVKQDFTRDFKGSIHKLEQQIEDDYVSNLRSNCFRERSYRENMAWRARNFGDSRLYEKAQNLKTPSCEKLQELYGG